MAAAVPRHGPGRVPRHPDDQGRRPRAGRAAGLPGPPGQLDAVDLRLAGHGHRRARTSRGCSPPGRWSGCATSTCRRSPSPSTGAEPVDPDAVEAFVAAAEPFGFTAGRRVPGVRDGRGGHRRRRSRRGIADWCATPSTASCSSAIGSPSRSRSTTPTSYALTARRLPLLGTAVPGLEMRIVDPETFEELPERHVGELLIRGTSVTPGLLQAARRHRRAVPRRLAVHRRPRLPARRRARAVRADQGRHHRRRAQRVPRGHRAGRRRARRRARRQRHRLRDGAATRARRASSSWPRCAGERPRPRSAPRSTTARSRCAGSRRVT